MAEPFGVKEHQMYPINQLHQLLVLLEKSFRDLPSFDGVFLGTDFVHQAMIRFKNLAGFATQCPPQCYSPS